MPGRTIAVGDIHGCDVALELLLDHLSPTVDDTFVLLGDAIDRGPDTSRSLEILLDLKQTSNLVFVMGNHEEMLLDVLEGKGSEARWLRYGGRETLASYGENLESIPASHRELIASAEPYWQTDAAIFTHASLEPEVPLENQRGEWLRWQQLTGFEYAHPSGKRVVCGHSGIQSGLPWVHDGWVCLDTLCYRGLWLTALDVETDAIWQARQTGELRYGVTLEDVR